MKGLFQISKNVLLISSFVSATALVTGCGAVGGNSNGYYQVSNQSSTSNVANTSGTTTIDGYTCPTSANITPHQSNTAGAEDNFTVCTNNTAGQLFITGTTSGSDQICIIPVESTNNIGTPNLSVQIQCPFASGGNGIQVTYSTVTFNAVAIVEAANAVQMYNCLAYGGTCPNYSYGMLPNATSSSSSSSQASD